MHSHAGVNPLPDLRGSSDDNELSNDITPYVRSIDGLNPLDHQIQVYVNHSGISSVVPLSSREMEIPQVLNQSSLVVLSKKPLKC